MTLFACTPSHPGTGVHASCPILKPDACLCSCGAGEKSRTYSQGWQRMSWSDAWHTVGTHLSKSQSQLPGLLLAGLRSVPGREQDPLWALSETSGWSEGGRTGSFLSRPPAPLPSPDPRPWAAFCFYHLGLLASFLLHFTLTI